MGPQVLIVGEQPNGELSEDGPLAGSRLAEYAGIDRGRFLRHRRVNLLPNGDRWSASVARQAAQETALEAPETVFVLCGRRVAQAFGISHGWLSIVPLPGAPHVRAVVIPHPSGRCRVWNDGHFRRRARAVLSEFL